MHQFQEFGIGPRHAQLLYDTETDARSPVHRNARRLIDGEHAVILVQHRKFAPRRGALRLTGTAARGAVGHGLRLGLRALGSSNRRQPDQIARLHAAVNRCAPLVDPDFAAADDPVDMGLGDALEMAHQKVVEPLPGVLLVDEQGFDFGAFGWWIGPYNVFH